MANKVFFKEASNLILIPVFNDWESLRILLIHLDEILKEGNLQAKVLVVDDASSISAYDSLRTSNFKAINKLSILELRRNLGHQRAIAVGLAYVEVNEPCMAVIIMDGDGEDSPKDILKLINECNKQKYEKIVFAKRTQRSEGLGFRVFYVFYKCLYKLLTGQDIGVGNFSIIPYKLLHRLVVVSEIWNHYAAGVFKAKIPYVEVPSRRSNRLYGHSKMNFVSLVIHGLSAISVNGDTVGVRLLVASCLLIVFNITAISVVLLIRITTNLAIPGWTSYIVVLFFIILMQAIMLSLFFSFVVLSARNNYSFLPQRDYQYFVSGIQKIFPQP